MTTPRLSFLAVPFIALLLLAAGCVTHGTEQAGPARPAVGETAPSFALKDLDGKTHSLRRLSADGPVVLVVLRGYIGKQCPLCTRQVGGLLSEAEAFEQRGARVVFIYPGPAEDLNNYARAFIAGSNLPGHYSLLVDPDFELTNRYGIRWDKGTNTAYPATFVIGQGDREVRFAKVSNSPAGRATPAEVLAVLDDKPAERATRQRRRPGGY